jgi:hypothetical protein
MEYIISIFKNKNDVNTVYNRNVQVFFDRIKNGNNKDIINQIRTEKDKKNADLIKSKLPAATFAGTFKQRNAQNLLELSGLTCLDFDYFKTNDDVLKFKEKIKQDKFVYACFISPSGKGLKVIVKIPKEVENYKKYYKAITDYFLCENSDLKTHDLPRLCFESYDPDLYINEQSEVWDKLPIIDITTLSSQKIEVKERSEVKIIERIMKWWEKKEPFIIGKRNGSIVVLADAFNRFGIAVDVALHICLKYEQIDFKKEEIVKIVENAYSKLDRHNTSYFNDDETKHNIKSDIKSGKSEKEIKDKYKNISHQEIENTILSIKENLNNSEYWTYTKKGTISLSHHRYKEFLETNNFLKYYPKGSDNFVFVKVNENIISDVNANHIKDFILNDLQKRENIGVGPFDFMANATKYFKDDYLSFIKTAEINLKEDTNDESYIYYKNCCLQIKKGNNKVKQIDYIDLDGYVWKNQIINRDFEIIDYNDSEFKKFLWLISGQNNERFMSLVSVLGYLMHSYKTSATNRAIIFNDETISDNPNGGSGKGIFCNALSKIKRTIFLDGKQFEFNKSFAYQTVSADTQVLVFDDVKKNFAFENLFSLITEGITLEKKNKDAIKIPISKSPKVVITTNYTIGGIGGSFERRKFEIELSSYFNSKHTPVDEFGHMLFDDWDEKEWLKFDNLMVYCLQYYLDNGLVKSNYQNLEVRKFIKETSYEFYEWVNDGNITESIRLYKSTLFSDFQQEYPDTKKYLSQKRFNNYLKSYALFNKLTSNEGRDLVGRYIQFN